MCKAASAIFLVMLTPLLVLSSFCSVFLLLGSVKEGECSLCRSSEVFPDFTAWNMSTLEGATFPHFLKTKGRVCLNWRVQKDSAVCTIYSLASGFGTGWWRWACLQSLEYCCPGCALQSLSFQLACWLLWAMLGLCSTAGALVCYARTSCSQRVHALFAVLYLPGTKLLQLWPEM